MNINNVQKIADENRNGVFDAAPVSYRASPTALGLSNGLK